MAKMNIKIKIVRPNKKGESCTILGKECNAKRVLPIGCIYFKYNQEWYYVDNLNVHSYYAKRNYTATHYNVKMHRLDRYIHEWVDTYETREINGKKRTWYDPQYRDISDYVGSVIVTINVQSERANGKAMLTPDSVDYKREHVNKYFGVKHVTPNEKKNTVDRAFRGNPRSYAFNANPENHSNMQVFDACPIVTRDIHGDAVQFKKERTVSNPNKIMHTYTEKPNATFTKHKYYVIDNKLGIGTGNTIPYELTKLPKAEIIQLINKSMKTFTYKEFVEICDDFGIIMDEVTKKLAYDIHEIFDFMVG